MWITKLKITAAVVLAVATAGAGVGLFNHSAAADGPPAAQAQPRADRPTKAARQGADPSKPAVGKPAVAVTPQEVEDRLQRTVSVDFDRLPGSDVVNYLREQSALNIIVDQEALDAAKIGDRPVNLRLKNVPLQTAMRFALRSAGLGYYVEDGVLVITTREAAAEKVVRRVYPVGDLIVSPEDQAENLIQVLTRTIAPNTWADEGGPAAIIYCAGAHSLVVNQSAEVHEQIRLLLRELRTARAKEDP